MEKRNNPIVIYFNELEKEKLLIGAKNNFSSISGYIRIAVSEKLKKESVE